MLQFTGSQRVRHGWMTEHTNKPQNRDSQVVLVVKNSPASAGDTSDTVSIPELGRFLGVGNATPPVFLPGKLHGVRSLVAYSPWGGKESDTT